MQDQRGECAESGGRTEHGEHAECYSERQAQCDFLRSHTLPQQIKDGPNEPAMKEAFFHAVFCWNKAEPGSSGFSLKSCESTYEDIAMFPRAMMSTNHTTFTPNERSRHA